MISKWGFDPKDKLVSGLSATRPVWKKDDPNKPDEKRPRSIDEIKEFYFEISSGGKTRGGDMMMASYKPGDYSDDEIEMYEQYKYDMNEQRPGMPIMEIDDFLRMELGSARAGVQAGGLPGILGV